MYKPTYHTLSKRGYITLLALLVSIITFAQGVTVKGTILDENKEPLIGATVQVKGETTVQPLIWTVISPSKPRKTQHWW